MNKFAVDCTYNIVTQENGTVTCHAAVNTPLYILQGTIALILLFTAWKIYQYISNNYFNGESD